MNLSISQGSSQGSRRASTITGPKILVRPSEKQTESEFNLDAFLSGIRFQYLVELDDEELEVQLEDVDALDLFNALHEVTRELSWIKLENHFITDFLERNDPKLLIGLKQRRSTAASNRRSIALSLGRSTPGGTTFTTRMSSRPSIMTTLSIFTTASMIPGGKKGSTDYRLNYRAKTEMAEKTAADVERRIAEMESKAMYKIKMLNIRIEELRYSCTETEETARHFELHFLKDKRDLAFLETATERQLECKLHKFVSTWLKNGRALLSTMRLRITSLQENCHQLRIDLMNKADLNGILHAVDFDQLIIKRDELFATLEEKTNHLNGLKNVTGKASLSMSREKKKLANIENESKYFTYRTLETSKLIAKLEREIKYVENENRKDSKKLKHLQEQAKMYEAPSVNEYIERKGELLALEKEEKLLQRKINIFNIKLVNTMKRCKRRDGKMTDIGSLQ